MPSAAQRGPAPVLVWDLDSTGHHAGYMDILARAWVGAPRPWPLEFVVGPTFHEDHPDVVQTAGGTSAQPGVVRWTAVPPGDLPEPPTGGRLGLVRRGIAEWRLMTRHARRLGARRVFVMYFDTFLQAAAPLQLPAPCAVSGIYFRPTAHYEGFAHFEPTPRERLRAARQRLALRLAAAHRRVDEVFCLDPFAVPTLPRGLGARRLADPVRPRAVGDLAAVRADLGLCPDDRLLLVAGYLTRRKGVTQAIEAFRGLAPSPPVRLVIAGPSDAETARDMERLGVAEDPRIVRLDRFLREAEFQELIHAADGILAPYERHVGSSAILIRAAAAGRPVIASGYGLMGELVRRHRLGVALGDTRPETVRAAIEDLLAGRVVPDAASMRAFAAQNTDREFADTLVAHLST